MNMESNKAIPIEVFTENPVRTRIGMTRTGPPAPESAQRTAHKKPMSRSKTMFG